MYSYEEQKNTLIDIHRVLKESNFLDKLHISLGTLLGAVRQGKLNTSLNDWDDLDFSVNSENFSEFIECVLPILKKEGFDIKYVWMTSYNKIGEITLYRGSDRLDVNQIFTSDEDGYRVHHHWYGHTQLTKGLNKKYYENVKPILLEGLDFFGPEDAEEYLVDMYGDTWKVPCKSEDEYKYWEDSPGVPWWSKETHLNILSELPE